MSSDCRWGWGRSKLAHPLIPRASMRQRFCIKTKHLKTPNEFFHWNKIAKYAFFIKQELILRVNSKAWEGVSNYFLTATGVPQGSVLSPLLFVIYSGDLPQMITPEKIWNMRRGKGSYNHKSLKIERRSDPGLSAGSQNIWLCHTFGMIRTS